MAAVLSILTAGVVAVVCWHLYRRFAHARIDALCERLRSSSRYASRAAFVDGDRHVDVALALTRSTLLYENTRTQASLELQWVTDIEYDMRLASGIAVEGSKILRLLCGGRAFEFVLANDVTARWHTMLPARRAIAS